MKYITPLLLLPCALFAGELSGTLAYFPVKDPVVVAADAFMNDERFSLSPYAAYVVSDNQFSKGEVGSGLQLGFDFTPLVTVATFTTYTENTDSLRDLSVTFILRDPSGFLGTGLTGYSLAGFGGDFTDETGDRLTFHAGMGAEYRADGYPRIFIDGQKVWCESSNGDTGSWLFRLGLFLDF